MSLLLIFLSKFFCIIYLLLASIVSLDAIFSINETDRQALLAFNDQIHGDPSKVMASWNESVHHCAWKGVSCNQQNHGRVTRLALDGLKLDGSVSPEIGNLTSLRFLDLNTNFLKGPIPQQIGHLLHLEYLNLSLNVFQGKIPGDLALCSNIVRIDLSGNNLTGEIPAQLQNLSSTLQYLWLAKNQLTRGIPKWLGNVSSLENLDLKENDLHGGIPGELGRLQKLKELRVQANNLQGNIPLSIFNLSSLYTLAVVENRLHGQIPYDIGFTLPNIEHLLLDLNNFYGRIPASLLNATKLRRLHIGGNNFSGVVPSNLGRLSNLEMLGLMDNQLGSAQGEEDLGFLNSLANCSNLLVLDLSRNHFKGELPASMANLSRNLFFLSIAQNQISGEIPKEFGNLVGLNWLIMSSNFITGEIPSSIGKLKKLHNLYLRYNKVSGMIPPSLGNITELQTLYLGANNLSGPIPPSLGNCSKFERLSLFDNYLTGNIPDQLFELSQFIEFDIANNSLTGKLPLGVGSMTQLVILNVSYNKLSGEMPDSLRKCLMLEDLELQANFLEGDIPLSWSSLKSLVVLDLSRNNLSGHIPNYLQNFTLLQYLDLSLNRLEGQVPNGGVFRNASAVSVAGNDKLCGGIQELGLPPCPVQVVKKRKTSHTLKVVVPIVVLSSSIILASLLTLCCMWRSKREATTKLPEQQSFPQISYGQLSQATNGFSFSNLIGRGSFGSVYRGILDGDGMSVAVKVLNLNQQGALKSFMAECKALSTIRHRNLIKVITVCSSIDFKGDDFKAIVYKLMQNGSLEEWLHPSEDQQFSFIQRLNTAIGVALATEYLHYHCQPVVIHGDLKPSNVLLDQDMVAHVADFGLSRFLRSTNNNPSQENSSTGVGGTIGYVPPEYGMGSKASKAGDVYSFGILLLEMITGKRPIDPMFKDGFNIHQFTKTSLPEKMMEILDPTLLQEVQAIERDAESSRAITRRSGIGVLESLIEIASVGVSCSMESPCERMEMKDVVAELSAIKQRFLGTRY